MLCNTYLKYIYIIMVFILSWFSEISSMNWRKLAERIIAVGVVLGSAYTIWTLLIIITKCESPVVVVLRYSRTLYLVVGVWSLHITEAIFCS